MDFAKRAVDHLHYDIDPIVRNRLDIDFYKLTMGRVIHEKHPLTRVEFALQNRTTDVRLADIIPIEVMRAQLDHAQKLRYSASELIWIRGNTFYGQEGIFPPAYIDALRTSRLPDYELSKNEETGQFDLRSHGTWLDTKDWETIKLSITNELRNRVIMSQLSPMQLDIMYARAKTKLYAKLERIKQFPNIKLGDFGTRRRHSQPWQRHVVEMMIEILGEQFVGTSNCHLAKELGVEAIGTNAHEMPMVYATLAAVEHPDDDEALRQSQYQVLKDWTNVYGPNMTVFLPDTFGTTQFLENAPAGIEYWNGARPDSKDPYEAGEELIDWWKAKSQNPLSKAVVFSDGLDVRIEGYEPNGIDLIDIHSHFTGRVNDTYALGTMGTNDFIGCVPGDPLALKPISLVCKVQRANGRPAVKISDNPAKAASPSQEEIARYMRAFGAEVIGNNRTTKV